MICLFYIVKNHFLIESYKIVYRHNDKYNHHNQTTLTMQNPHSIDAPHYTTHVLDSHHTGQPSFDSHDYTSMPHHGLSPNDKQNTHWFGSNHQLHTQRTFTENNIILPPDNKQEIEKTKSTFVVIDSRSRNHTDQPNPNSYTVPLPNEIRDVESVQLISYNIPKPQFPVRSTNNVFYLTNAEPSVTENADGTTTVDLHKDTSLQSVMVDPGYYSESIDDHTSSNVLVTTYKGELLTQLGITTLKQDMFSSALEAQLNANTNTTCIVYIEEHNDQYTLVTNFANSIVNSDNCDTPFFFHPFFEGCDEFYGPTTTKKVNICDESNPVYKYEKIGKKQRMYLKNSMGPIIGHPRKDPSMRVSGMGNNSTSVDRLHGTGTSFTTELRKGDWVYIYDYTNSIRKRVHINEVISDTECAIDCDGTGGTTPGGPSFENAYMWVGRLSFPWVRNLHPDRYIAMYLNNAPTLHSYNQAVDRAFFLVPGNSPFYEIRQLLPYKKFSPTLGKLDKLTISFKNADNTMYDFKGRDHVLLFKIVHYRQNIKYGDF